MKFISRLFLTVLVATSANSSAVQAQSSEAVSSFESRVLVQDSGYAQITETITYNFGTNQRQGIFRDIPLHYEVANGEGYVLDVNVVSVQKSDGNRFISETYQTSDLGDYLRLRIGREGIFISDRQTYRIAYTLGPVAVSSTTGTEIVRIDAPGTGWSVPVENTTLVYQGPEAVGSTCYQGASGSTAQVCEPLENGFAASGGLAPGETITVEYEYPAGTFSQTAVLVKLPTDGPPWWIGLIAAAVVAAVARPVVGYLRYRKRRQEELVVARYTPPAGMKPADIGLLFDNSSSGAELSATIIDLAVRGYLKIIQTAEKRWWRSAKYSLQKQQPGDDLKGFEGDLFKAFFKDSDTAELDKLKVSSDFQSANISFHKDLKKRLEKFGFYKKANLFAFDLASRMTDEGYTKWAAVEGFREFLKVTEADRMAFHDAPEKKPEQFSEYLPFAVALGVEKQWAEQFKDLSVDTSWYQGPAGQHLALANISSFTSGLNTAAVAANRSSGSSGFGGGSSGGGFSGGGGGSW